ncbi:MAG: hypothetical protein LBD23_06350 [Oscillospiraceae bacterium]|jgi:hypothetical protein|nr:hypothetical protein [Oscillospiraceae bacterium]
MKKLLAILLVIAMLFTVACNSDNGGTNEPAGNGSNNDETSDTGQSGDYISIEKSVFSAGEEIVVTATGITEEMQGADAFVAIYKAGAEHDEYQQYLYPKAGDDTLHFDAPTTVGSYEMRLYNQDHIYTDETFVESLVFTAVSGNSTGDTNETSDDTTGNAPSPGQDPNTPNNETQTPDNTPNNNQAPENTDYNNYGGIPSGIYSFVDEDSVISYTFKSDGTFIFRIIVDGAAVLEDNGTYEINGNIFKGTDSEGNVGEHEFKLDGNTLTFVEAWFYEDLVLVKE